MRGATDNSIDLNLYWAAILDMDGVITRTARVHMAAWRSMFNEYLQDRTVRFHEKYRPFTDRDYYLYVDGKPRYEGALSFLKSRELELPRGKPEDAPGEETVCGLGNRKNEYFRRHLKEHGVERYESTIEFVEAFKHRGGHVGAVSASRNARDVLTAAKVYDLFDVVVDGVDAAERQLQGKPHPDIFLEAARQLRVKPAEAILVEDALAGVEAGRAGGFALVIGIDRSELGAELRRHGADLVVTDLRELDYDGNEYERGG